MKKNYAIGKLLSVYLSHIFLDFDQSEQTSSKDAFGSYRTSTYKLNYLEVPTGLKIVLNTDLNIGKIDDVLHGIYKVAVNICII